MKTRHKLLLGLAGGGGDATAPSVVVSSASSANVELPYSVTFTFSEDVTGFAVGDITVGNGSAGTFAVVSASVYTATITPTAPGAVTVQVAAGVCTDTAGNANAASNVLSRTYVTLSFTATTTGAQTLTLQRITPTGANVVVDWGDGGAPSTILNGNTGTTTHNYAGAGTWAVTITQPGKLTYIDLQDAKITTFNSSALVSCSALTHLSLNLSSATVTFNNVHIASMALTHLYLNLPSATVTFNSVHIASMALTTLSLSIPSATGVFNSADIASMALTYLYVYMPSATGVFNSADIASMALTYLYLYLPSATGVFNSADIASMALTALSLSMLSATVTFNSTHIAARSTITNIAVVCSSGATTTITRADWDGFPACGTIRVEAGLAQAEVDAILLGLYDGFAAKTVTGGTIDLLGQSNAAPSGVLQAANPPTTGYESAYELVNDSAGVSTKHWVSATTA